MNNKKLYKVTDVAEEFGVTSVCVRKWIQKGELKVFVTPGGHCRILPANFIAFVQKYKYGEDDMKCNEPIAVGE